MTQSSVLVQHPFGTAVVALILIGIVAAGYCWALVEVTKPTASRKEQDDEEG